MSAVDSFIYFPALPPELRLQIWTQALSVRSVWAAVRNDTADRDLNASNLPLTMAYVGAAPYLVGLSCREARRLLEQLYEGPIRGPFSGLTPSRSYWVDLDTTVVYLGDFFDMTTVLDSFGADKLSKLKHVALPWYQFGNLARACQHLTTLCPALRTLIIQRGEVEAATKRPFPQTLSLETATYYATIPEYSGPELGYEDLDVAHFRSLLLEYFGDTPPRLHLLSPDSLHHSISQRADILPTVWDLQR
jgi:hypothetical protein